jgi:hypothetical protein
MYHVFLFSVINGWKFGLFLHLGCCEQWCARWVCRHLEILTSVLMDMNPEEALLDHIVVLL